MSDPTCITYSSSNTHKFAAIIQVLIPAVKPKNEQAPYVLYLQFTEMGW